MYPIVKPQITLKELMAAAFASKGCVARFEKEFAKKMGAKHCVSFAYARSALYALLKALDISGKKVIVPAYTCVVVPHAIVESGNRPVFVDVKDDFNMDVDHATNKVDSDTAMVIPTDMYGCPMDVASLRKKVPKDVLIIEDACLAIGVRSERTGADARLYSFNMSKQVVGWDGGAIVTDDDGMCRKIREYRDSSFSACSRVKSMKLWIKAFASLFMYNQFIYGLLMRAYKLPAAGRISSSISYENWRVDDTSMPADWLDMMSPVQASLASSQLKKLDSMLNKRKKLAEAYHQELEGLPVQRPVCDHSSWSHYTIRVENRDEVRRKLFERGVNTGRALDYANPDLPAYAGSQKCPNASKLSDSIINLPFHTAMDVSDVRRICQVLRGVLNE